MDPEALISEARRARDLSGSGPLAENYSTEHLSDNLRTNLAELHGLRFLLSSDAGEVNLYFDVVEASGATTAFWLSEYERRIGQTIVPVGFAFGHHMLVHVSEDGSLFGSFDYLLWRLGENLHDTLGSLLDGPNHEEIP